MTSPAGRSGVPREARKTADWRPLLVLLVSAAVTFAAGEISAVAVHRVLASDDAKGTSTRSLAIDAESIEARLLDSASYLASDELEGRGVGTEGLDRAAEYIAEAFAQAGLQTELYGGKPFHVFHRSGKYVLGSRNALHFAGPKDQQLDLKLDTDYRPLSMSSSGRLSGEVVFAGYGITAPELDYDDYAGLDVAGKYAILLRHEPRHTDPDSPFAGSEPSEHAYLHRKISNAVKHGAAGVLFCTNEAEVRQEMAAELTAWKTAVAELDAAGTEFRKQSEPTADQWDTYRSRIDTLTERVSATSRKLAGVFDPLLDFSVRSNLAERVVPVLHVRRKAISDMLEQSQGQSLAAIEQEIDETLKPRSSSLPNWKLEGIVSVDWSGKSLKNVVAVRPGSGRLAGETVVVGAHYDHLGYGGWGSLDFSFDKAIHNGADDNASGTTVLLEVGRQLGHEPATVDCRRIVFIAFTAEEQGLIGSERYVNDPLFPLETTTAMVNLDMVGRLRKDSLTVYGTGTADEFAPLMDRLGKSHAFQLTTRPGGNGPSDHASFHARGIPVLHFFTGFHPQYHRPSDDTETLNIQGMRRIAVMTTELVRELATSPEPFHSRSSPRGTPGLTDLLGDRNETRSKPLPAVTGAGKAFLGVGHANRRDDAGYLVGEVLAGGPAERAGLRRGDLILKFDGQPVDAGSLDDFVADKKPGEKATILVRRGSLLLELEAALGSQ